MRALPCQRLLATLTWLLRLWHLGLQPGAGGGQTPQRQPEASASLFLPQLLAWPTRASQWLLTSTGLQREGQRVAAISERVAQPGNHKPIWVTGPSGDQAGPWLPPPHTGH